MKTTSLTANGTSFHGQTILASLSQLTKTLGTPHTTHPHYDKVQHEWTFETESGEIFTVYDWKEYRIYDASAPIEWHIGAHNQKTAEDALQELKTTLK